MEIKAGILIKRSISEVFSYVSHFENDTQWWLGVIESRIISDVKEGVGTQYFQLCKFMGKCFGSTFEVIEYNPVNHVVIRSIESAIPFKARYALEPAPEGTQFTMYAQVEWLGFYKLIKPFANFIMQCFANKFFKKLKHVLELPNL